MICVRWAQRFSIRGMCEDSLGCRVPAEVQLSRFGQAAEAAMLKNCAGGTHGGAHADRLWVIRPSKFQHLSANSTRAGRSSACSLPGGSQAACLQQETKKGTGGVLQQQQCRQHAPCARCPALDCHLEGPCPSDSPTTR